MPPIFIAQGRAECSYNNVTAGSDPRVALHNIDYNLSASHGQVFVDGYKYGDYVDKYGGNDCYLGAYTSHGDIDFSMP